MAFITLDFETAYRSKKNKGTPGPTVSLKNLTYEEYLRGSWVRNGEEIKIPFKAHGVGIKVDREDAFWVTHDDLDYALRHHFPKGNKHTVLAHNTMFDGAIMKWVYGVSAEAWYDTKGMSQALWPTESASLDALTRRLFPDNPELWKDKEALDVSDGYWDLSPEQEKITADYCIQDVDITFEAFAKMWSMGFPQDELIINAITLKMFIERPFVLDQERITKYQRRIERNKQRWYRISGWPRSTLASNDKFVARLEKDHGIVINKIASPTEKNPDNTRYPLAKDDLEFLELRSRHPELRAVWNARLAATSNNERTRAARYLNHGMMSDINPDGRLAQPLNYYAAHTGRWGGTNKQNPQNLGRKSKLRLALKAPEGHKVVVRDLSNIEGRMAAWFCGQDDMLALIASGGDIYNDMATSIYGYPINRKLPEHAIQGFVGKVACLGPDTPVFTQQGLKKITDIQPSDKLWDGEAWVKHEGLLHQGIKDTVKLAGISLTSDHKILCGNEWKDAKYLVQSENTLCQALTTGSENCSLQVMYGESGGVLDQFLCHAIAPRMKNTLSSLKTCVQGVLKDVLNAPLKQGEKNGTGAIQMPCLMTPTGQDYLTDSPQPLVGATTQTTKYTKTTGAEAYKYASTGGTTNVLSLNTYSSLMGGIKKTLKWIVSTTTDIMNPVTSVLYRVLKMPKTNEKYMSFKHKLKPSNKKYKTSNKRMPVYDLLNVGPNNRFTILSEKGPLIVHNCLGLTYNMGAAKFRHTLLSGGMGMVVDLPEDECRDVVYTYRKKNNKISGMWRQLQGVIADMANPNLEPYDFVCLRVEYQRLVMPNGLSLVYPDLRPIDHPDARNEFDYWNGKFRKKLYGGLLLENICQGLSRIVMSEAMIRIDTQLKEREAGMLALTVHDENVAVVKEEYAEWCNQMMDAEMSKTPTWCDSRLVLATDGGIDDCYSK